MSSRENPRPVCVKSFVPKEKNWASRAISPAVRHARGSSIIVPIMKSPGGIIDRSPFATVDERGVGELIEIAIERGRAARPGLEVGICGEHGGDPASIRFFHAAGLDYVSCSPFRVPIARVAAAQAAAARSAAA